MLCIDKLELYNWCSQIGAKTINFTDGFNVINGRNGKGKTSIVDAISILLIDKYEGAFENFINDTCTEASAKLFFSYDNNSYESGITIVKKKSTSTDRYLKKNDETIATGEDCAKTLEKMLPSFLTDYSLFYRQSGNNKVTECTDSERRNLLTQLISLDYSTKIKQRLNPDVETLEKDIGELETKIAVLTSKTYTMGTLKPIKELHPQSELERLKNQVKIWENNAQNISRKLKLETDIVNATRDLENAKVTYNTDNIIAEKNRKLESLKANSDEKLKSLEASKTQEKDKSKEVMQNLIKSLDDSTKELSTIQIKDLPIFEISKIATAKSNIATIKTKLNIAQSNYEVLKTGVCPTCGGKCEHKADDLLTEVNNLNSDLNAANEEERKLSEEKDAYDKEFSLNEAAKRRQIELTGNIETLKSKIEAEKTSIVNILKSIKDQEDAVAANLESEIANANTISENSIKASEEIINQKTLYLQKLQSDLSEIVVEDVPDCRSELATLEAENLEIEKDIAYNKGIEEQNKLIEQQKVADAQEKENLEKDLTKLKMSLADHQLAIEIMSRTYPTWRLERDLEYIKDQTNVFVEDIYKDLNVRFSANKNSLKMVYGNGDRDLPVKRLSGAERQIVNLGVENIFNQQQNLSCLILDESDSAMDAENKETFFSVLIGLEEHYEQVIVITHSKEMKQKLQAKGANIILL